MIQKNVFVSGSGPKNFFLGQTLCRGDMVQKCEIKYFSSYFYVLTVSYNSNDWWLTMEKSTTLGWDLPALLHRFFYSIFFNWKNNNIQLN